jgi:hypothetical protein
MQLHQQFFQDAMLLKVCPLSVDSHEFVDGREMSSYLYSKLAL